VEHKDKDLAVLKKQIIKDIDSWVTAQTQWLQVIEVKETHPFNRDMGSLFIGLDFDRYLVAKRPDGTWIRNEWDDGSERIVMSITVVSFATPCTNHRISSACRAGEPQR